MEKSLALQSIKSELDDLSMSEMMWLIEYLVKRVKAVLFSQGSEALLETPFKHHNAPEANPSLDQLWLELDAVNEVVP